MEEDRAVISHLLPARLVQDWDALQLSQGERLCRGIWGLEAGMEIRFNLMEKQGEADSCSLGGGIAARLPGAARMRLQMLIRARLTRLNKAAGHSRQFING